jgi:ApeA N-terminal domain 1
LRKRLDALAQRLFLPLRQHILSEDGDVPQSWVDTRNYYTHWNEASRDSVLDGVEMHRAGVRMRHFLRALYLDFAGVPQEAIARALRNASGECQYLIQLNIAEHRKRNPTSDLGALMRISVKDPQSPDDAAS